jgi:hypothetical protein
MSCTHDKQLRDRIIIKHHLVKAEYGNCVKKNSAPTKTKNVHNFPDYYEEYNQVLQNSLEEISDAHVFPASLPLENSMSQAARGWSKSDRRHKIQAGELFGPAGKMMRVPRWVVVVAGVKAHPTQVHRTVALCRSPILSHAYASSLF